MNNSKKLIIMIIITFLFGIMSSPAFAAKMASGRVSVASGGTPEALNSTSQKCDIIYVTAFEGNTDIIVVGESDVDATEATRTGTVLFAGQTIAFPYGNVVSIYVDVEVNDEGASWLCIDK